EPTSTPLTEAIEKVLAMPASKFAAQHKEDFFFKAFPDLFPFGYGAPNCAGPLLARSPRISMEKIVSHYFRLADPRFRHHGVFRFLLFNNVQRHRLSRS